MAEYIFEINGVLYDEKTGQSVMKPEYKGRIVRCKDCKHKYLERMVWVCPFGLPGGSDFFCGYGEERETDD